MSQFIDGFHELGENFTWNYHRSARNSSDRYYQIEGENTSVPLRGFGAALAASVFVHDYDCIGNSGANMGYVVQPDGFAEIIKIDPGEALSFAEDMSLTELDNDPEKREVRIGTSGRIFRYTDLNYEDKKEFAETIRRILEIPNRLIEELFSPFLEMDKRFETLLTTLLKRKKGILNAFSEEVRVLVLNKMKDADEERAKNIIANWEKPIQFPKETESNTELIKNRAYLEATVLSSQSSSSTKMFQVPTFMEDFIGRKEELETLKQHLSLSSNRMNYAAIVGLSGLGKTQLTTEYIRLHKDSYSDILWLNADNNSIIYNQILMYLQVYSGIQLPLQDPRENCVKMFYQSFIGGKLQEKKKRICIVLDSTQRMKEEDDMIKSILLPKEAIDYNVDIIITSSYQKWEAPVQKIINLQKFSSEDVREYLKSKVPNREVSNEHITQFSELHDGLSLAIAQAAAYIQHNNLTVSQYIPHLEEFQKTHNFHLSLLSLIDEEPMQNTVQEDNKEEAEHSLNEDLLLVQQKKLSKLGFSSLVFSLANLRVMSKIADSILGVFAYLSTDYIIKSMLQSCWLEYMKQIQATLPSNLKLVHQQLFEEGLDLLMAHSFVKGEEFKNENMESKKSKIELNFASSQAKKSTDTILRINSLTQSLIRLIHQQNGLFDMHYKSAFDYVLQQLEYDGRKLDEIQRVSWMIPHGTTLINMKSKIGELKYLEMLNKIGCYQLYGSGEYKETFNKLNNVAKISMNVHGEDHAETAIILVSLGNAWGSLGNYEKEKELLTQALEIFEKYYGKDHPQTAIILTNLGNSWGYLGNYKKRKDLLTRALEIFEKHYGKDHPGTGITLGNLGNAWGSLGNYEMRKDFLTRALEIFEKHFGIDHISTVITLGGLGNAWESLGNYEKQKDFLTRALEIYEKHFGIDHPNIGITLTNLGNAWGSLGDHKKQKDMLTRALEIKEKHYGIDHLETGITLDSLGNAWGSNFEKKRDLLTRALEIFEKHYGKYHPQTGITLSNLAIALFQIHGPATAVILQERAHKIHSKSFGKDHPRTIWVFKILQRMIKYLDLDY